DTLGFLLRQLNFPSVNAGEFKSPFFALWTKNIAMSSVRRNQLSTLLLLNRVMFNREAFNASYRTGIHSDHSIFFGAPRALAGLLGCGIFVPIHGHASASILKCAGHDFPILNPHSVYPHENAVAVRNRFFRPEHQFNRSTRRP